MNEIENLIAEVVDAQAVVKAMEKSGERPAIDEERAIYNRRDNAIAALSAAMQSDGRDARNAVLREARRQAAKHQ